MKTEKVQEANIGTSLPLPKQMWYNKSTFFKNYKNQGKEYFLKNIEAEIKEIWWEGGEVGGRFIQI